MEKQLKLKNKILKILPKAAAAVAVAFQNHPFSPGRDHKSKHQHHQHQYHGNRGFSGQISMIPYEARRNPNGNRNNIDYQEPTSPKISCMGQIKNKNKNKQIKKTNPTPSSTSTSKDAQEKKHVSKFQRMLLLQGEKKPKSTGRKSNASAPGDIKDALEEKAPHVNQMKRFASGRDTFANFDWKAQVAPEEIDVCYSDEDRVESDVEDDDDDDDDFKIPFSAPILAGGGLGTHGCELNLKPRKEINLWKRRTMAPPRPLQLNPS